MSSPHQPIGRAGRWPRPPREPRAGAAAYTVRVPAHSTPPTTRRPARWLLLTCLAILVALVTATATWQPWNDADGPGGLTGAAPSEGASPTDAPSEGASSPTETPSPTPAPDAVFTIGAVGDVLPHDTPIRVAHTGGDDYDFTPMLEATREWSEGVDLALCNMEVPLSMPGERPSGYPLFGAPMQIVANLAGLGWDGCATATNHTIDRGADNAMYTLDVFDSEGLGHAGSARSAQEAATPQYYDLERAGQQIRVAQIAATYGTNGLPIPPDQPWLVTLLDADQLIAQAETARENGADLVVASLHWGLEYQLRQNPEQEALAEKLAASGAIDLIIGNHPHVPQPMAKLPGGPGGDGMWVAYSLGNFISNQDSNCCIPETATGLFMTATVTKPADGPARVTGMEWTPMTVDRLGNQRAYPLPGLLEGEPPAALTLSRATLEDRMARVESIMENSAGADFPLLTTPPEPTGEPPVVVPRAG
ncbi:CapA family protein [Pseudactinotalea sp. HY160]|nr:CapA family protein [Pseudactinotalea sp. HY160]